MRELSIYLDLSRQELLNKLAIVSLELMHAHDQLGFLKSEELSTKREIWLRMPEASIQVKDRSASYSAADHTMEIYRVEAERSVLIEERNFLQMLIQYASH